VQEFAVDAAGQGMHALQTGARSKRRNQFGEAKLAWSADDKIDPGTGLNQCGGLRSRTDLRAAEHDPRCGLMVLAQCAASTKCGMLQKWQENAKRSG